ncbi:pyruvate dehydrogenase kinase protein [Rutstroemia sp. NJR-2017a BBW]|nr:pyruvate dehydrogenase kinase protein [Rutstroemia sp. NJR-2017a BBW]
MNLKFGKGGAGLREVSERKQVGDAESMVNEGRGGSGMEGVFTKGGGEV